jgi:hypothetical protein
MKHFPKFGELFSNSSLITQKTHAVGLLRSIKLCVLETCNGWRLIFSHDTNQQPMRHGPASKCVTAA